MKITIESTSKIVELALNSHTPIAVPARVWQGTTDSGIPVVCYVTRIAVHKDAGAEALAQFERELKEQRAPTADVAAIPLRLII